MTTRTAAPDKTRKTAIAVPARLLAEVDAAAKTRGESRSRFIQRVLREAVRARNDADVRKRINLLFSDAEVSSEQVAGAEFLGRAGTRWATEKW